jgi:hypothetical protein
MKTQGRSWRRLRIVIFAHQVGGRQQDLAELKTIAEHHQLVEEAGVWPFDVRTVVSFAATLGGPLIVTLLTELMKGLFLKK